jgi:hypothetical protein
MEYGKHVRFGVQLVQEPTAIIFVEYTTESPGLFLKWLDVLNFDQQDIAGLGGLNVKWTGEVMDLSEIYIFDIVGRVIISDLPSCPIETLNLDGFVVGDCSDGRN